MDEQTPNMPPDTQSEPQPVEVETDAPLEAEEVEQPNVPEEPSFTWQASEFVHHHKGAGWYATLAIIIVALLAIAIIFKFWLSIGVFVAMGVAIAVYAHKPPRVLTYTLDSHSITIEGKTYPYKNFRSFSVLSEPDWHTIDLEPTQRFMPRLTVLFSDEDFDTIVDHLSLHLPRTDRQPDMVERVTRYLRF